jgi:DNA polymerase-1
VDGDGLAYYCAGNDDTTTGEARHNVINKIESARRLVGASDVRILTTASGSHKGHRYAISRVKPYQGQRSNSRRPKNWQYLRDLLQSGQIGGFDVEFTGTAEADDLFGKYAYSRPQDVVIYTQDKDMRMLPGMHLEWVSHHTHVVPWYYTAPYADGIVSAHSGVHGDKQYGPKWFWLQMLHGDPADNIPGLPKYQPSNGVFKPVGEVTAGKLIDAHASYIESVQVAYESYYAERWLVNMLEQACLLWMRRVPEAWDDCVNPGGPLEIFNDGSREFALAYGEIEHRVRTADIYNSGEAEDNPDRADAAAASH